MGEQLANLKIRQFENGIQQFNNLPAVRRGSTNQQIDMSDKPKGIYFVVVESKEGKIVKKIVIQ